MIFNNPDLIYLGLILVFFCSVILSVNSFIPMVGGSIVSGYLSSVQPDTRGIGFLLGITFWFIFYQHISQRTETIDNFLKKIESMFRFRHGWNQRLCDSVLGIWVGYAVAI